MNTEKSKTKLPEDLRSTITLVAVVGLYALIASLLPDCGVFVNASLAALAGGAIFFTS